MRNRRRYRRPRPPHPIATADDIRWSGGAATIDRMQLSNGRIAERVRYDWRGKSREVFVSRDPAAIDELLRLNWHRTKRGVAMDIEYHKNSHEPAVVSVATDDELAILWHRPLLEQARRLPAALGRLLTTPMIPKIGVGLDDDLWKLAAGTDFLSYGWPRGVMDLQTLYRALCRDRDPSKPVSLIEVVNGSASSEKPFYKRQHGGDWQNTLTPDQLAYAAGDVFATWQAVGGLGLDDPAPSKPVRRPADPTAKTAEPAGNQDDAKRAADDAVGRKRRRGDESLTTADSAAASSMPADSADVSAAAAEV